MTYNFTLKCESNGIKWDIPFDVMSYDVFYNMSKSDSYEIVRESTGLTLTQTEINDMIEDYRESQTYKQFADVDSDGNCLHRTWIKYIGFTEVYEYCKKCDLKRFPDGKTEKGH